LATATNAAVTKGPSEDIQEPVASETPPTSEAQPASEAPPPAEAQPASEAPQTAEPPTPSEAPPPAEAPPTTDAAPEPDFLTRLAASGSGRVYRRLVDLALAPAYAFYTRRLRATVLARPRPNHVAVIMDGNRRWAAAEGHADPGVGHRAGAEKALQLIDWCAELGIGEVTLWALSIENLDRSTDEVATIADVAADAIDALSEGRRRTRVPVELRIIGRRDLLPEGLSETVERSGSLSKAGAPIRVTIALAYSGRDELLEAFRATVRDAVTAGVPPDQLPESLTADSLAAHLYTHGSSDPDLIIRTSGELRLSGFLPWQSVYSEYHFAEAYWPAFREIDFLRAIRTYQQRGRRFGR
jgi:short-chain Z-isoprenyl diphosphate synthase